MYNREEEIIEQYEVEVKSTAKGRGALICDTDQGTILLKEFCGSKERAVFLHDILDFLAEEDFLAETIMPAKDGEILVKDELTDITYISVSYTHLFQRIFMAGRTYSTCNRRRSRSKNCTDVKPVCRFLRRSARNAGCPRTEDRKREICRCRSNLHDRGSDA